MFAHRHSDGHEQYDAVLGAVRSSPDLIALGQDGRGEDRFTSRGMIETEQRLSRAAEMMAQRERHPVFNSHRSGAPAGAAESGMALTCEESAGVGRVTDGGGAGIVAG